MVNGVKLCISALRLENGELLVVVSPYFNAAALEEYALRWEIETLFGCMKGRGFNLEDTRLTDPRRVKKLIAVLAIAYSWCYITGVWQHDLVKPIVIKKHGRPSVSLFRYGLDYIQTAFQDYITSSNKLKINNICNLLAEHSDRLQSGD